MSDSKAYDQLVEFLNEQSATYRVVEHPPEGRTEMISQIRGNTLGQAAKAMVVMVKIGKKEKKFFLAVVPGDARINLNSLKSLVGASYAMFAPPELAAELTNCEMGAIPPFSFRKELELVVDPELLARDEIVFNAGCLDKSIFIKSQTYARIVNPRMETIAQRKLIQ